MIDIKSRYQKGLSLQDLFPSIDGKCACGCDNEIAGRKKKWFSESCRTSAYIHFAVVKGDAQVIRWQLYQLDRGACRCCGEITENWEADHIIPVYQGGGGCDLTNYQTLCKDCHKMKTQYKTHRQNHESEI